ncbi:MAG: hypothetical protein ACSHX9_05135 [Luteolibacter sp.]
MTDENTFQQIGKIFGVGSAKLGLLSKNGRSFLALPREPEAFRQALNLYQPQRTIARVSVALIRACGRLSPSLLPLKQLHLDGDLDGVGDGLPSVKKDSLGILLGSSEHRVRRAIVSFQTQNGWEVAKVAFGAEGAEILETEANALRELAEIVPGVPELLGLHSGDGVTILRMPYLVGTPARPGAPEKAIDLLNRWSTGGTARLIDEFPEWSAIHSALNQLGYEKVLSGLTEKKLKPVVCHGDFARWNLRLQDDQSLMALDWEWGHSEGMPGLDLVHYFLQDARLVARLGDEEAIQWTRGQLSRPETAAYLEEHGWNDDPTGVIIASLAYKQGAGHQENSQILRAACELSDTTGH